MDPSEIDWKDSTQVEAYNSFVKEQVTAAVDKEVTGLKRNNEELLKQLKTKEIADTLDVDNEAANRFKKMETLFQSIGGEDGAKELAELKLRIDSDDKLKKITSGDVGQIQEIIDAETSAMRKSLESQNSALSEKLGTSESTIESLKRQIRTASLADACSSATSELKCLPGMQDEVFRHAQQVFEWSEDHKSHVISENGIIKFGQDGRTPMTVKEWLDETREQNSYRWAPTRGGGGLGGAGVSGTLEGVDTSGMSMAEYRKHRNRK